MSVLSVPVSTSIMTSVMPLPLGLPQRPEAGANLVDHQLGLFPRGKVPAFIELVVMNQFWICSLRPAPRSRIELVGENAHRDRDLGNSLHGKERRQFVFPVQPGAGDPCVGQPREGDVVQDVVTRKAGGFSC